MREARGERVGGGLRLRRPARSYDLHQHLTTLFVCAVATVVLTRSFLAATGYPQVGNAKLHIAHVLYGGLLMLAALMTTLAFLSPAAQPLAAVAGGAGFGLFIDEVGKFVTRDVDYFYKPAIAIIYVTFCVMFGVIRWLSRRGFNAEEATLIAIDALERSAVGSLRDDRRRRVLALLRSSGADGELAREVAGLLERCAALPDAQPTATARLEHRAERAWDALTSYRLFRRGLFALLGIAAAISAAEAGWLLRHGLGALSFSERAFTLTTVAADALLLVGALRLSRSLLSALRWYDHAVLLEITVGQVFLYGSEQLAATLNLVALILVWLVLRWAIEREAAKRLAPTPPAAVAAAA